MASSPDTTTQSETAKKGIEILDFWAEWCGPCKLMAPILEEIKKEHKNVIIREIDVDDPQNSELRDEYFVMSVPTYIFLKDGEVVKQIVGAQSKDVFSQHIQELLSDEGK